MSKLLPTIKQPADLKALSREDLVALAGEVREFIVQTVSCTGGHLAPNLGAVELTIALHRTFDSPTDKLIWDVGHQCYTHKLLTGRQEAFPRIRQEGGPSGFPRREESRARQHLDLGRAGLRHRPQPAGRQRTRHRGHRRRLPDRRHGV